MKYCYDIQVDLALSTRPTHSRLVAELLHVTTKNATKALLVPSLNSTNCSYASDLMNEDTDKI